MVVVVRCAVFLLLLLVVKTEVLTNDISTEGLDGIFTQEELLELLSKVPNEEYIRHIHSIINTYRNDLHGERMVIETNSMIDTKYKTWKRNADLINSLLALPKGMDDAGR